MIHQLSFQSFTALHIDKAGTKSEIKVMDSIYTISMEDSVPDTRFLRLLSYWKIYRARSESTIPGKSYERRLSHLHDVFGELLLFRVLVYFVKTATDILNKR